MAQFRTGILPLRVETGKFTNVKLEECVWKVCEDEKHFLCKCSLYDTLRISLYDI